MNVLIQRKATPSFAWFEYMTCLLICGGDGAEDWNRTSDTSIFSAVLYRLSYLGTRKSARAEPSSYQSRQPLHKPQRFRGAAISTSVSRLRPGRSPARAIRANEESRIADLQTRVLRGAELRTPLVVRLYPA